MSIRQQLKKKIYKRKQSGLDSIELEKQLQSLSSTDEVILAQKQTRYNEIYEIMDTNNFSSEILDKFMNEWNELSKSITKLKEKLFIPQWQVPYNVKYIIRKRSSYDIDTLKNIYDFYKDLEPEEIKIIDNDVKTRYIVLSVNGKEKRFNIETKKEFVDKNYYWLSKKLDERTFRRIKINYTNVIKYIK